MKYTLSGTNILLACAYPFREDVKGWSDDGPNFARDRGTGTHNAGATYINSKREALPSGLDESGTWASMKAWIDQNWQPGWVAEPAYAWDPAKDVARLLGVDIGREYEKHGKLPHEIAGTCDVVHVLDGTVYVYEFATGYDVEHKLDQLRAQCMVAARAHGRENAVGRLIRFREDGAYPFPPLELDYFELALQSGALAERIESIATATPQPGEHCGRCNARTVCPEGQKVLEALIPPEALTKPFRFSTEVQGPEHALWMVTHAKLVEKALEDFKAALKAACPPEGWRMADGSVLREGFATMPGGLDKAKALALLRELGATDEQIEGLFGAQWQKSQGLRLEKPKARRRAA